MCCPYCCVHPQMAFLGVVFARYMHTPDVVFTLPHGSKWSQSKPFPDCSPSAACPKSIGCSLRGQPRSLCGQAAILFERPKNDLGRSDTIHQSWNILQIYTCIDSKQWNFINENELALQDARLEHSHEQTGIY